MLVAMAAGSNDVDFPINDPVKLNPPTVTYQLVTH